MDPPQPRGITPASVPPPRFGATNVRSGVLALVAFAAASAYLTRNCIAAANTTIQGELGLDDEQMGSIMSAFFLGYFLFQVPAGWAGTRFGTRAAFAALSVLWSMCNLWSGLASAFGALYASRFGLGLFQAGLAPISAKILNDWIPAKSRGVSSAAIGAFMSVGGALTLWLTGRLLRAEYDWRGIFSAYSMVGIVWAVGFAWFFRTRPENHPRVNEAELKLISAAGDDDHRRTQRIEPDAATRSTPANSMAIAMLASPSMWFLCVQAFFRSAGYAFFATWFFAFLEYAYGIDKAAAGFLTSLPLIAVVCGTLTGGFLVDVLLRRTGNHKLSRSGVAALALALSGSLTASSTLTSSATQLSVVIAIGAFFAGFGSPASWATTMDLGGKNTALVMGTMNMAACLAGVVLPWLLGRWFDTIRSSGGDWDGVIYLHAAFYFTAAAAWILINPNRPIDARTPST